MANEAADQVDTAIDRAKAWVLVERKAAVKRFENRESHPAKITVSRAMYEDLEALAKHNADLMGHDLRPNPGAPLTIRGVPIEITDGE